MSRPGTLPGGDGEGCRERVGAGLEAGLGLGLGKGEGLGQMGLEEAVEGLKPRGCGEVWVGGLPEHGCRAESGGGRSLTGWGHQGRGEVGDFDLYMGQVWALWCGAVRVQGLKGVAQGSRTSGDKKEEEQGHD